EARVQLAVLEFGKHGAQRRNLRVRGLLRDQACRHAFERGPGGDHLDHFAPGFAHDVDSTPRDRADKALALKLRQRFAYRGATHSEISREPSLVEPDIGASVID